SSHLPITFLVLPWALCIGFSGDGPSQNSFAAFYETSAICPLWGVKRTLERALRSRSFNLTGRGAGRFSRGPHDRGARCKFAIVLLASARHVSPQGPFSPHVACTAQPALTSTRLRFTYEPPSGKWAARHGST